MSYDSSKAVNFLKQQKERFAKNEGGELPPHLIVESKDGPEAIIIAPSLDKDLAMKAAYLCSLGFQPNSMTLAFDALMSRVEEETEKQDCIICHNIDKDGEMRMSVIPYTSVDNNVFWLEEQVFDTKSDESEEISGDIPATLVKIINERDNTFLDDIIQDYNKEGVSAEQAKFQTGRTIMSLLIEMGFKIVDLFSYKHPEWTDAKEKGLHLVKEMVKMQKVNPSFQSKLEEDVKSAIGNPSFVERFEHHLTEAKCKVDDGSKLIDFVLKFQQTCMQPNRIDIDSVNKILSRLNG
jgi:hypothetical protein